MHNTVQKGSRFVMVEVIVVVIVEVIVEGSCGS